RDFHVTGVQTCALPIWPAGRGTPGPCARPQGGAEGGLHVERAGTREELVRGDVLTMVKHPCHALRDALKGAPPAARPLGVSGLRSEERRVGKECRAGWR